MEYVNLADAKARLSELVGRVERGESVEITRRGKPAARHDGWTPARQAQFLVLLAHTGVVGYSARGVGMSHASAYKLRARPGAESFAAAWDRAIDAGRARAFDLAYDRAVNGVTLPRYYRGKVIGRGIATITASPSPR